MGYRNDEPSATTGSTRFDSVHIAGPKGEKGTHGDIYWNHGAERAERRHW